VNINMTDINSAAISSLHYEAVGARFDDFDKVGDLVVTFKNGGSYVYHNVSVLTLRRVLLGDSIGSAIAKLVRPEHSFTKLGEVAVAPADVIVAG